MHLAPNFTQELSCHWGNCTDMGMKNDENDSPMKLIDFVLDQSLNTIENLGGKTTIDGIIITGDFVRHHYYYFVTNDTLGPISEKHNKKSGGLTEY